MTTLTLTITDDVREFIEAEAAKSNLGDVSEYVRSLIAKERERAELHEFHESLREAILGPATLMTPEDWEDIRREGKTLLAEGKRP